MAEFSRLIITEQGKSLIAKALKGEEKITFSKISACSKSYQQEELEKLNELEEIRQTCLVSDTTITSQSAIKASAVFSNEGLAEGYYLRALGLYASGKNGDILYAVAAETGGGCYIPPFNGVTLSGINVELITSVGNSDNVSIEVNSAAAATVGQINELRISISSLEERVEALEDMDLEPRVTALEEQLNGSGSGYFVQKDSTGLYVEV